MLKTKRKLTYSIVALVLISSLLVGSAYAFSSGGPLLTSNNASGSSFDVELYWSSNPIENGWNDAEESGTDVAFDKDVIWEAGHSELRYFKIRNAGDTDFTFELDIEADEESPILGDVIGVFATNSPDEGTNHESLDYIGTLNHCFAEPFLFTGEIAGGSDTIYAVELVMEKDAGNEYQGQNIPGGFTVKVNAYAEEPEEPVFDGEFGIVLPNYEDYLYRVGNSGAVSVASLFDVQNELESSAFDESLISYTVDNYAGNAGAAFKAGTSGWKSGSFTFTGTGVVKITLNYNGAEELYLYLEVVDGKNVTTAASATNTNIILLNDVSTTGRLTVSGNHTLYGNGFSITDKRTNTSGADGFVNIENGTLDNVQIIGQEYPELVEAGTSNQYYSPCVYAKKNTSIYNSYLSGCKSALMIEGDTYVEGTTVAGGAYANISISGGDATLKNCTTSHSLNNGLKGLAVVLSNPNSKLNLEGTFRQYNWIQKSELPTTYQNVLKDIYNNSTYAYTYFGKSFINTGVLCLNSTLSFTEDLARAAINDNTSNTYSFIQKTYAGVTATCYTAESSMASPEMIELSGYDIIDQYPTAPAVSFDFTGKNYIPLQSGSNKYCYYDSTSDRVNISFESTDGYFEWDPMILSASKYGTQVNYTVKMNGVDYTGSKIRFTAPGNYEIVYSYTDSQYYYGRESENGSINYEKRLNINVVVADPEVITYKPGFVFGSNGSVQKIISNKTYVMPDVSATSDTIGSTKVGTETVYYPIVTVNPTASNGNTAYSEGKGYYFAPAFSAVSITDYNQETGAQQYTYNSSSKTWPHGKAASSGPDSAVFGYADGAAYANQPYGRSLNSQYYGFGTNNSGLCYTTKDIEKDNSASSHLVQFHYVGNDGITYYYYIKYNFTAMTHEDGPCFTSGTLITLSDGTQKPVEEIRFGDKLLTWNFITGKFEEQDVCLIVNHGSGTYDVLNTVYSDGTVLRIIGTHGVFDYDLNKFIYLTEQNYKDYIGHRFVKYKGNGQYKLVKLVSAFVTKDHTCAYSVTTAYTADAIAQGLLTMAPPDDFYNWMEMGEKLRYDTKQIESDIKKYGTYGYEDFCKYLTPQQFEAFNGPYLKAAVQKGKFTFDYLIELIRLYSQFMS